MTNAVYSAVSWEAILCRRGLDSGEEDTAVLGGSAVELERKRAQVRELCPSYFFPRHSGCRIHLASITHRSEFLPQFRVATETLSARSHAVPTSPSFHFLRSESEVAFLLISALAFKVFPFRSTHNACAATTCPQGVAIVMLTPYLSLSPPPRLSLGTIFPSQLSLATSLEKRKLGCLGTWSPLEQLERAFKLRSSNVSIGGLISRL
jgi:hypothetical protein